MMLSNGRKARSSSDKENAAGAALSRRERLEAFRKAKLAGKAKQAGKPGNAATARTKRRTPTAGGTATTAAAAVATGASKRARAAKPSLKLGDRHSQQQLKAAGIAKAGVAKARTGAGGARSAAGTKRPAALKSRPRAAGVTRPTASSKARVAKPAAAAAAAPAAKPRRKAPVTPKDKPVKDQLVRMTLLPCIEEALMYKKIKQPDKAREVFARILTSPELPEAKGKALYWIARARLEEDENELPQAVAVFEEAFKQKMSSWERKTLEEGLRKFVQRLSSRGQSIGIDELLKSPAAPGTQAAAAPAQPTAAASSANVTPTDMDVPTPEVAKRLSFGSILNRVATIVNEGNTAASASASAAPSAAPPAAVAAAAPVAQGPSTTQKSPVAAAGAATVAPPAVPAPTASQPSTAAAPETATAAAADAAVIVPGRVSKLAALWESRCKPKAGSAAQKTSSTGKASAKPRSAPRSWGRARRVPTPKTALKHLHSRLGDSEAAAAASTKADAASPVDATATATAAAVDDDVAATSTGTGTGVVVGTDGGAVTLFDDADDGSASVASSAAHSPALAMRLFDAGARTPSSARSQRSISRIGSARSRAAASSPAVAAVGSVVVMEPVKASKRTSCELGSNFFLSPVRRSARVRQRVATPKFTAAATTTAAGSAAVAAAPATSAAASSSTASTAGQQEAVGLRDLLEAAGFAYRPNPAIPADRTPPGMRSSPVDSAQFVDTLPFVHKGNPRPLGPPEKEVIDLLLDDSDSD